MGKPVYRRRDNHDVVPWRMAIPARDEQCSCDERAASDYVQRQSTIPGVPLDVDTRDAAAGPNRSANDRMLEVLRADSICEYDRHRGVGSYMARRQRGDGLYHVRRGDRDRGTIHSAGYLLSQAFTDGSILQSDYIEAIDDRVFGIRTKYKGHGLDDLRGHGGKGVAFHAQAVHGAISGS